VYIQFSGLPVHDQARAKQFYIDNLGCTVAADVRMGGDWRWIELKFGQSETALHFVRAKSETSDDPVMVLVADDVAAVVDELRRRGVDILTEPHSPSWQPGRTVAEFRDSEGNRMMIGSR
jgi:predicted enzyme related to lactoylglutathione lyase